MSKDLIPITDAQAELGKQALITAGNAGGWVAGILQDVPRDLIGVLGGDWLHHTRQRNLATLERNTAERLDKIPMERRTEPSPSLLLPLLQIAVNESREELQKLWSTLLAQSMADNGKRVRAAYFEIVRQMEPVDAIVLRGIGETESRNPSAMHFQKWTSDHGISQNDLAVACNALHQLGVALPHQGMVLTPLGRGFLAAVTGI